MQERTGNSIDPSTCDPCRLQYTPRKANPAATKDPFLDVWKGTPLDIESIPIAKILREIEKAQADLEEYRAGLKSKNGGGRPGDDFNLRGDILPYLLEKGARVVKWVGTDCYIERPGGSGDGHNAIIHYNHGDFPILINFSPNWKELWEPKNGKAISIFDNFGVLSRILFSGNISATASALVKMGFGSTESSRADESESSDDIIQTFDIKPLRVLDIEGESHQKVECVITTQSGKSFVQLFTKGMFSDPKTFNNSIGSADAIFLGKTSQLRRLQVWLTRPQVPRVQGVKYQGRWTDEQGKPFWVTTDAVFSEQGKIESPPVVVVSELSDVFVPLYYPNIEADDELLRIFADNILNTNFRHVILPILGWHMACPYKAYFHDIGYRFPILNVWGTRGAGKTSQIQLFQRLLGYREPQGLDCFGKLFVQLNRWGATNGIPMLFTEYRRNIPETAHTAFIRDLMMGYDGTIDARGRPDLSVVLYPKLAPVIVDGNDSLHEPALLERIIQVHMAQNTLHNPDSEQVQAYYRLFDYEPLQAFAVPYILWTLRYEPPLRDAGEIVLRDPGAIFLSERIRKNLEVIVCGLLSIKNYMLSHGYDFLPTSQIQAYVKRYIQDVASTRRLDVEDFVEDLFYMYQKGGVPFLHVKRDPSLGTVLWCHLGSVYPEWSMLCRRTGRSPVSVDALEMQLQERLEEYVVEDTDSNSGSFENIHLWGIVLNAARQSGLDIPGEIS